MSRNLDVGRRAAVEAQARGGADRECGDARRMAMETRELQIANVAECGSNRGELVQSALVDRPRLLLQQLRSRIAAAIENLGRIRREGLDETRIEDRAAALAHAIDGQVGAADIFESDRISGEVRDPSGRNDGVLRSPCGAPPPLHHSATSYRARSTPGPMPICRATQLPISQLAVSYCSPNAGPSRISRSTTRRRVAAGSPRVASGIRIAS